MKKRQVVEDAACRPPSGNGSESHPAGWMGAQCVVLQRLFSCRDDMTFSAAQIVPNGETACGMGGFASGQMTLREARDRVERYMVHDAIQASGGNMSRAAEVLGVSRPALYDLAKKYGLCRVKPRG
ncbi:helix-turn-helix domain-containing protein [Geomonas azotofigens]|uniref:helix-turn-helix domain-containing protein n=1 Tax=Geomonas azotofigens TaxID=2843196 RepID=UPI001F203DB0|nr:helix-turn-helix domain-containing protein [Geomonas azotofigens]